MKEVKNLGRNGGEEQCARAWFVYGEKKKAQSRVDGEKSKGRQWRALSRVE